MLTREMLDGLDNFWRARAWDDLSQTGAGRSRQGAALYLQMGGNRRETLRRRRGQGFQRHHGDPRRRGETVRRCRLCDFAGVAGGELRRRTRLPDQRSRKTVRAHRLYRDLEHVGKSGGCRSTAVTAQKASRSACRSSAAASTTSACCGWRRRSRACAAGRSRGRRRRRNNHHRHSGMRPLGAGPESIHSDGGYGFRARAKRRAPE